jgi:multidrug transporter EmrE-like cation transporter
MITNLAYLSAAIVLVVYSNLIVKARATRHVPTRTNGGEVASDLAMLMDLLVWTAIAAIGIPIIAWALGIKQLDLDVAQPAMGFVFMTVPVATAGFLGEPIPPLRSFRLTHIVSGVALVAKKV